MHSLEQFVDGKGRFHGAAASRSVQVLACLVLCGCREDNGNETRVDTRRLHVCKLETDSRCLKPCVTKMCLLLGTRIGHNLSIIPPLRDATR